jgi:hypothetical protein
MSHSGLKKNRNFFSLEYQGFVDFPAGEIPENETCLTQWGTAAD